MKDVQMKTKIQGYIYKIMLAASALSMTGCGTIHGDDIPGLALAGVVGISSIIQNVSKNKARKAAEGPVHEDYFADGYNLTKYYNRRYAVGLKECSVDRFDDSDTLCYVKLVTDQEKDGNFYFMELNERDATILVENTINDNYGSKEARSQWFTTWLDKTKFTDLGPYHRHNKYWTYYKQRHVFTQNHPEAVEDPTVRGMGTLPFNQKTASEAYQRQVSNADGAAFANFFLAMMIMNSMGYQSKGKYYCNGLSFDNEAAMEDYKNANGLK